MLERMNMKPKRTICIVGDDKALNYAAQELQEYLQRMSPQDAQVSVTPRETFAPAERGTLWLSTWDAVPNAPCLAGGATPHVDDPSIDDAYVIEVRHGQGVIAGANARSVLLGVYRLLWENGCRWVRPGPSGECIPQRALSDLNAHVREAAAYRHRGICIEGAVSYENVAQMIDWAPKLGFNAYFFQFREAYTFFERWYAHRENPTLEPEPFPVERAREFVARAEGEMARRGLLYHAVGHGWTCEPLGLPGLEWEAKEYDLSPKVRSYLAEVDGERQVWGGIPLNTNLCYSNPEVREMIVEDIVRYLQEHETVDLLHFWLADGSNNQCECAACREKRPSDWYVMMLNQLDERLTAEGLEARIVFLIYVDLLWPPEAETIANPDRFVLMFAPITRSYSEPLAGPTAGAELLPYERNRLTFPSNVQENVAFLRAWQRIFPGDSFDFDYHMMWDHYSDPGYYQTARILGRDATRLKEIGLRGFMSCQVQRAFFPSGLNMVVLGRMLWDDGQSFEAIAEDYFRSAYGADGPAVQEYLARLSELFDPPYLRGERPQRSDKAAARFAQIPGVVHEFAPTIADHTDDPSPCVAQSWAYLQIHAGMVTKFAGVLEARARGDLTESRSRWNELKDYLRAQELAIQPVFDLFEFIRTMERKLFPAEVDGE